MRLPGWSLAWAGMAAAEAARPARQSHPQGLPAVQQLARAQECWVGLDVPMMCWLQPLLAYLQEQRGMLMREAAWHRDRLCKGEGTEC